MSDKRIRITCKAAGTLPIEEIHDLQGNLKELLPDKKRKLKLALTEYGFSFPVFVWRNPFNHLHYNLDGNQRLKVMRELKDEGFEFSDIPVAFIDANSEKEAREKLLLATSQYGKFSNKGAKEYIEKMDDPEAITKMVDLPEIDFSRIQKILVQQCDPDDIPKIDHTDTVVKYGDLWRLGENHLLLCGDATDKADVDRLLNGDHVTCAVFDVPYGVEYDGLWRTEIDGCLNRKNGTFDDTRWDWADAYKNCNADVLYLYHASLLTSNMQQSVESAGYELKSRLVWLKTSFTLGRSHYQYNSEPVLYCIKKEAPSHWQGSRKETTVFKCANGNPFAGKVGKEDERTCHTTQKPVYCYTYLIKNSSAKGDIVADFFAGSGSAVIAAEQLSRKGRFIEIDPYFCGIILERYLKYTGIDPIRNDGVKYSELKAEHERRKEKKEEDKNA